MIKYIGSKRLIIPWIQAVAESIGCVRSVLDAFSGTARVGHALKRAGYRVVSNDHNRYASVLARCLVAADGRRVREPAAALVDELNRLPGRAGYVTETFCVQSRYFQPHNGERIDAIRSRIEELALEADLEAVLLTSLMLAADRVDSTTGVQMAYLKQWARRSYGQLELRVPPVLDDGPAGACVALELDALDAVRAEEVDLAYLDPPYNQHKYIGNYHVWETIARWDHPETYGIARKRVDCRQRRSPFNSKLAFDSAFRELLAAVRARHVLVSFSNEGFCTRARMEELLGGYGEVGVMEIDYPRYVGARIGIHDNHGRRVGRVGRLRNRELLYLVGPGSADIMRAAAERAQAQTHLGAPLLVEE